jgi:hypothetical protein
VNGFPNTLPIHNDKNWERWQKQMKSLFGYQDTLEVVTNGVQKLQENTIDAQRNLYKDVKEALNILVKYYESGEKVKSVKFNILGGNTSCCKWIKVIQLHLMHQRFKV